MPYTDKKRYTELPSLIRRAMIQLDTRVTHLVEEGVDDDGAVADILITIGQITNELQQFQQALGNKADANHGHSIANIGGLESELSAINQAINALPQSGHGHAIGDVSGLQTALDTINSTLSNHNHAIGDVSGLQDALDDKSDTTHTHDNLVDGW